MKKFLKISLYVFGILFLGILGFLSYLKLALPNVGPAPDLKVEATEARIKRGEYLATSVTVCMDCHSTRDWSKYAGPLTPGTLGKGGEIFNQDFGFPGAFYSKNITPHGIGTWTDGEIYRAITSGVTKSGKAIFPVMPHGNYGKMDKEDIYSIIAYLRTLKPVESTVAESVPDFPMNFIINTIPKPANHTTIPDKSNREVYGAYVFNAAACGECHTKQDKGKPVEGMTLAGGFEFKMPFGIVRSPNITPDKNTGIGSWTEAQFIQRFKIYADSGYVARSVGKDEFNTVMPWMMYSQMTEEDLGALYAYLRTVKPIGNTVERFTKN